MESDLLARSSGLVVDALDGVLVRFCLSVAVLGSGFRMALLVCGLVTVDLRGLSLPFKPDDGSSSLVFIVFSSSILKAISVGVNCFIL